MPLVQSSAIRRIEFDRTTKRMQVWFTGGGGPYTFYNVPEATYVAFMSTSSHGRFYDEHIKDRYASEGK